MRLRQIGSLLCIGLLAFALGACDGPAEKAGKNLDEAVEETSEKIEDAKEDIKETQIEIQENRQELQEAQLERQEALQELEKAKQERREAVEQMEEAIKSEPTEQPGEESQEK